MALHNAKSGLGSVAEYQASGVPAVTELADGTTVTFTKVTKAVTVWSLFANVTLSFDDGVVTPTTITLPQNTPIRLEIKTKQITCAGGTGRPLNFIAELTSIDANQCPVWDNSNNELYTIA